MRLLLIEDDRALSVHLAGDLARAGYAVDAAYDGTEGEFLGRETAYDAVILDLGLPGLPGLEVLVPAWGLHVPGTAAWQADYVRALFDEADRLRARFVTWFLIVVYGRLWFWSITILPMSCSNPQVKASSGTG